MLVKGEAPVKKCRKVLASLWVSGAPASVVLPDGQGNADIRRTVLRRSEDAWRCLVGAHHPTQKVDPSPCSAPRGHSMFCEVYGRNQQEPKSPGASHGAQHQDTFLSCTPLLTEILCPARTHAKRDIGRQV